MINFNRGAAVTKLEFEKRRLEVEELAKKCAAIAREKIMLSHDVIAEKFQYVVDMIKSGDYSAGNIMKHIGLAIASAALSIFTPEVAIAFTAVAMMSLAAKFIKNRKPYVGALVGISSGLAGFTLGNHIAEITWLASWKVLREFTEDVVDRVKERLPKAEPVEA